MYQEELMFAMEDIKAFYGEDHIRVYNYTSRHCISVKRLKRKDRIIVSKHYFFSEFKESIDEGRRRIPIRVTKRKSIAEFNEFLLDSLEGFKSFISELDINKPNE